MAKTRGHRITVTYFVPCPVNDLAQQKKTLEWAEKLEKPGEHAPEGLAVESFSFRAGTSD